MTWEQLITGAFEQSPFLAFSREDLRKIEKRRRSKKSVYVRFGYQWKDPKGNPRRAIARLLKKILQDLCEEVRTTIRASNHKVDFASLRGEAGTFLLRKIQLDIMSADILVFDLTYRNPNVLFELGIAYAMGRRFFLIVKENKQQDIRKDVPSNLAGVVVSPYRGEIKSFCDSSTLRDFKGAMREVIRRKIRLRK